MDEARRDDHPAVPVDLRHTPRSLGSAVSGYGLTPSSVRERAAVVRAVTQDAHIRQRPMPVVIATGLVTLVALGIWGWQLYLTITQEQPLSLLFWGALATSLAASAVCSWAWQLYDVRKAFLMWIAIVFLGIAAVLIIVLVLVALKGEGDDLDIDLGGLMDRITGSGDGPSIAADLVAPLVLDTVDGLGQGIAGPDDTAAEPRSEPESEHEPEPEHEPATDGPACPNCGRPLTAGLLRCPRCGGPLA